MWIQKPEWKTKTTYIRRNVKKDEPSIQEERDSDSEGNIAPQKEELLKKYLKDPSLIDVGLKSWTRGYWTIGIIRCCICLEELTLFSHWANTCPNCESEYDGDGGLLAHRSLWGEETGEVF